MFFGGDYSIVPTWNRYMEMQHWVQGTAGITFEERVNFFQNIWKGVVKNYDTTRGKECYFMVKQDVDYPMFLVEWWAKQTAYEPGNSDDLTACFWRQCWQYIGEVE